MKKTVSILLLINVIIFSECKKENPIDTNIKIKNEVNGQVQKGPFINGSTIDIFELDKKLLATGNCFSTQITDNSGLFEFKDISLKSQYVKLRAVGFYFNEITGTTSLAPITLYALSDIEEKTLINVNIITNLEKSRIEYLISLGETFLNAKKQAESEILKIFSIIKPDIGESELLDISKDGDDNAILLAISLITQGYRTEAELSELLANISTDIRVDGILNSPTLGAALINDVRLFDLAKIRNNIEKRYIDLGMTVTISNFEKYIKTFKDSTKYVYTNNIIYPEYSNYGENILNDNKTNFSSWISMAASLPKGTSLKIILKTTDNSHVWSFSFSPNGPINWSFSGYNSTSMSQVFTATGSGIDCDLSISFPSGVYTIEYYENNSLIPTRTKSITVN